MDHTNPNLSTVTADLEEESNNAISEKPSVKSYATRVFQESTVGIVSSILTTHSKYRRFFKVFLSSLCVAGFIYHCVAFLNHVFVYPEVIDTYVDRSETYNWPAYTYCSNNPIRRSVFCSIYPDGCIKPSEEFCKKFSSYCEANATFVLEEDYYNILPYDFHPEWILKYGSVPNILNMNDSYLESHSMEKKADEISGPYLRSLGTRFTAKACYSIHSRVESNLQPLQKTRKDTTSPFLDEWIRFNVDETEMINPKSEPGVYFSVHNPFEAVNPFKKGIFLKGGKTYYIYVGMQEEVLLKEPFESNCVDYDERWEKNNRTGPRAKQMCREKCYFDYDISHHQCISHYNQYPHKERICVDTPNSPVAISLDKCLKNCRDECRSSKYTTEVSIQDFVQFVDPEEEHRHIEVRIYLSNDEVKVLRHSPKYETVDVISSVGGFMGCWLGIALMDILDVIGSIITVCRYAFRKKFTSFRGQYGD